MESTITIAIAITMAIPVTVTTTNSYFQVLLVSVLCLLCIELGVARVGEFKDLGFRVSSRTYRFGV